MEPVPVARFSPGRRTGISVKTLKLADNLAAARASLAADELERLAVVSALPADYPGWIFERQREFWAKMLAEANDRARRT